MPLVAYLYLGSRSFALFNVVPTALFAFIDSVRTHMSSHGNTYHNFSHAVDVMHGVFVILMSCDAA